MTQKIDTSRFCVICLSELNAERNPPSRFANNCECCGIYRLSPTAAAMLAGNPMDEYQGTAVAYKMRRMSKSGHLVEVDSMLVRRERDEATLPRIDEIIDEAVLWIGAEIRWPGQTIDVNYPEYKGVLGAIDDKAFHEILKTLLASGWIAGKISSLVGRKAFSLTECQLTQEGWRRYQELNNAAVKSRHAFMAMKYGDSELDAIVKEHFAKAVARTGFELRRLDQNQPAGLIDDQLRVQIRTARFLVCDLTHGNRGAYWEAGFAEGLSRPVIYTCREDVFNDATNENRPHFDTNHFVTVSWRQDAPHLAAQRLVDTIRATLPTEAILEDVSSGHENRDS
jgi:hypothetical protein